MPVRLVQCPHCSKAYSIDGSPSAQRARCKSCGHVFSLDLPPKSERRESSAPGAPESSAGNPTIPERIGRFEIRQRLGAGGFGAVYRAYDPVLDREVALKLPHPGSLQTAQEVKRFLREAKAAFLRVLDEYSLDQFLMRRSELTSLLEISRLAPPVSDGAGEG
jgi:predicted Zn finger-like uncharacterized protein